MMIQRYEEKKVALITLNPTLDIFFYQDDFSYNKKIFVKNSRIAAGGSGVNVARGLQAIGHSFKLFTIIGGDIGDLVNKELAKERIPFSFSENKEETRVTSIVMSSSKTKMFVAPSPKIDFTTLKKFIKDFYTEIAENDLVLIGGSIPEESSEFVIMNLIDPLIKQGVKIIIDSRGIFAERVYMLNPFIIKYNNHDNSEINHNLHIARNLHKKGASLVIQYNSRYCYAIHEDYVWRYPNFTHFSKRIYGRGDAFLAGLISEILNENNFDESIRKAIACGASFTSDFPLGQISPELIESYLRGIHCDFKRRII